MSPMVCDGHHSHIEDLGEVLSPVTLSQQHLCGLNFTLILKAVKALSGKNDMVDDIDADKFAHLFESARDLLVCPGR